MTFLLVKEHFKGAVFLEPWDEVLLARSRHTHQHLPGGLLDHTDPPRPPDKLGGAGLEGDASVRQHLEGVRGVLLDAFLATVHGRRGSRLGATRVDAGASVFNLHR